MWKDIFMLLALWCTVSSYGFQRHNHRQPCSSTQRYAVNKMGGGGRGGGGIQDKRNKDNEREIEKANKFLEQVRVKKEAKTARKVEQAFIRDNPVIPQAKPIKEGANYAQKTIWGANVIQCRPFSVDGPKKFDFLGSFTSSKALPIYPVPEIAFLGRSNVGKSSLLNCLTGLNKKIAVESKTPGRTQCINMFSCADRDGSFCNFADLPGYGYAKISKTLQEEISYFLRDYLRQRGSLRLAVLLVDVRREPQVLDAGMMTFLKEEQVPFVIVATKTDKLKRDEVTASLATLRREWELGDTYPLVPFSAVTGEGAKELWRVLRSVLMGESSVLDDSDEEFDGEQGLEGGDMGAPDDDDEEDDEEEEGGSDNGGVGGIREDGNGSDRVGRVRTNIKASTTSTSAKASAKSAEDTGKGGGKGRARGLSVEDYMD